MFDAVKTEVKSKVKKTKKKDVVKKYVVMTKCFWGNQLYNAGDTVSLPADVEAPEYFVETE